MESFHVSPDDESIEALLKEGLARHDLPDAGFSARVMADLPAQGAVAHYRAWLFLGWTGTITGACAAIWACVPWSALMDGSSSMGQTPEQLPAYAWTTFALGVTMLSGLAGWYLVGAARQP
jgi:hypothetical protein